METIIIDGKKTAQNIIENIKEKLQKTSLEPSLAVISAGDDIASEIYVKNKINKAKELGFKSFLKKFDKNTTKEELESYIEKLNNDPSINAILLQLPLYEHLDEAYFLDKISPQKDVDGFNSYNAGLLFKGDKNAVIPCTPKGIIKILDEYKIEIEGKTVIVIGRSNIVGKPAASLLLNRNATVITAHSKTKDLKKYTLLSDIIISATGVKNLITADMIKEGAVVIDVGITRDNGKITGDVDTLGLTGKAAYITPVPGGVGPVTVAMLMDNTYELARRQK